MKADLN
jgi:hypothetical protein